MNIKVNHYPQRPPKMIATLMFGPLFQMLPQIKYGHMRRCCCAINNQHTALCRDEKSGQYYRKEDKPSRIKTLVDTDRNLELTPPPVGKGLKK